MLSKLWDLAFNYLKARPYWSYIEPFVLIAVAWGAAQVLAYQWLAASSSFNPTIGLFLSSYLSIRITIGAFGIVTILLVTSLRRGSDVRAAAGRFGAYWQAHRNGIMYRTLGVALVVAAVAVGFRVYSPNRVSHITVRFMALEPSVAPEAVAYLIYELNRRQRHWYFNVDFRPFTEEMLTSDQANRCRADERPQLCQAEALAEVQPFIGITAEPLGGAYFAEHRRGVSVISTFDRAAYEPLSTYEYLAYTLVLQGIAIHLDLHGGGLPPGAFEQQRVSHGGLFQFVPEKQALKSSILAARLGPDEEALLLNRFGSDYVATCATLLTMDWLYSERVRGNLERVFGAKLGR
jgi:hypothetical protein